MACTWTPLPLAFLRTFIYCFRIILLSFCPEFIPAFLYILISRQNCFRTTPTGFQARVFNLHITIKELRLQTSHLNSSRFVIQACAHFTLWSKACAARSPAWMHGPSTSIRLTLTYTCTLKSSICHHSDFLSKHVFPQINTCQISDSYRRAVLYKKKTQSGKL